MADRKLKRDEQKTRRELELVFQASFKQETKSAGWGYLKPTPYKRIGEWFITLHPMIWKDAEKAELWAMVKPFGIDDLVSRILGFAGLDGEPLSLRARGPHCLVPPMFTTSIETHGDLGEMVDLAMKFEKMVADRVRTMTLDDFIVFSTDNRPPGKVSLNEAATLILAGRLDQAAALCESAVASKQWGGPARATEAGQVIGFFELALAWLRNSARQK